ncbi:carbohydrate-binding module family 1 protein [Serendipita vermifera MAFF 305830]|uniref:Glucanase n=1 Tax=Serendipita vermifera MAFF 305830 TaxID=933852 RepID=A0A0C2X6S9_SERVB|nr:carbohydrate-binding module family 1 protein [Serendipita vermifera MAFF 305830]
MFNAAALLSFSLLAVAYGQQVGTNQAEVHPSLTWQVCAAGGSCTTQQATIVIDANWRWLHSTSGFTNCYTGNAWDTTLCPDPVTCAKNCAVEGASYASTYGITTSGNALTMKFVTKSANTNIGSRVYLMASDNTNYQMFKLKNHEFTFDVDVSNLPCGLNGALYFSNMKADGGLSTEPNNKAGAKYGTGYCDAQCPHDIKFIKGEANTIGWAPSSNDSNAGRGKYGTCCSEMDIWEANSISTAYTPHSCTTNGPYRCEGTECGDGSERYSGVCDKDGCDFNSYRMGDKNFYGPGKVVDTAKKMTVVTQFITADGTDNGTLKEIRRVYVQDGKVIANSKVNMPGMQAWDSVSDAYCAEQKTTFGDNNHYATVGGMGPMDTAFAGGVVLVMSIWDDHEANLLWLDSNMPADGDPSKPGVARGSCPTTSGVPSELEAASPNSSVTYSNIKFGPIGSTYTGTVTSSSSSRPVSTSSSTRASSSSTRASSSSSTRSSSSSRTSSTSSSVSGGAAHWAQCGGIGWNGATSCVSPYTCTKLNDWFYQCL